MTAPDRNQQTGAWQLRVKRSSPSELFTQALEELDSALFRKQSREPCLRVFPPRLSLSLIFISDIPVCLYTYFVTAG